MSRTQLMGAASAVALSCLALSAHAQAPTTVRGSGATLPQLNYAQEIGTYNSGDATIRPTDAALFSSYLPGVGSGGGIRGFVVNDYTCFTQAAGSPSTSSCLTAGTAGGANTVHYGATDAKVQTGGSAITSWATSAVGQSAAGNLIQIPMLGTGVAIGVGTKSFGGAYLAANGKIRLTDHDLCEIYSGGYTDWSQITDTTQVTGYKQPLTGPITAAFRSDGSGTTFLFTNHLAAVCTAADVAAGFTFRATQTFSTLFPASKPYNATNYPGLVPAQGNGGVRNALVGTSTAAPTAQIGFISPDFTTAAPGGGVTGTLPNVAALLQNGLVGVAANPYVLPLQKNVLGGLTNGDSTAANTENLTPPNSAIAGANPTAWVPLVPVTTKGYPIVGYTNWLLAQCYQSPAIQTSIVTFLTRHYNNVAFRTIQTANGFVPVANTSASSFGKLIFAKLLSNTKVGATDTTWNINIGNPTACNGLVGR